MRSAARNTFASSTRTARLRAIRLLLTALGAAAGLAWSVGWLATPAAASDLEPGVPDIRRLVASAFLLFVFVVDGFGRGPWTRTHWEGRFADRWLPAAGVHPAAVSVRHTVHLILRALPFAWIPLLPVQPDLLGFSIGRRLALLLAAPACSLTGDAIGVLSRRGSRWIGAAFAIGGGVYWVSLLPLFVGGHLETEAVLIPARTFLLSRWNVAATLIFFTPAVVVNSLANWWGSDRARARAGAVRAARSAPRSRPGEIRARPEATAHAQATMRRLSSWVSQQWLATGIIGAYALMPVVAIAVKFSGRPDAMTASEAVWPLAISLALPALVCSEVVWGTLSRDMWALFRINARSLHVPLVVPGVITAGILSIWVVIGAGAVMMATPAGIRSAGPFAGAGLLLAAHCAALQTCAGTLALRFGAHRTAVGRAVRYAGTAAGVLIPALIMSAEGPWVATVWVALVTSTAPVGAVAQFSRCQFGHDLESD